MPYFEAVEASPKQVAKQNSNLSDQKGKKVILKEGMIEEQMTII